MLEQIDLNLKFYCFLCLKLIRRLFEDILVCHKVDTRAEIEKSDYYLVLQILKVPYFGGK